MSADNARQDSNCALLPFQAAEGTKHNQTQIIDLEQNIPINITE
jgi:hypothetical protein